MYENQALSGLLSKIISYILQKVTACLNLYSADDHHIIKARAREGVRQRAVSALLEL